MSEKLEPLQELEKHSLFNKINELVDAVNGMLCWHENLPRFWQNLSQKENTENEEPTDLYAKQRWVGCLCRFRHGLGVTPTYGILGEILPDSDFPYYKKDTDTYWKYCEPVKPDDDIIYKGGDNVSK